MVLSSGAEDFNWSWEKDSKAPAASEKPDAGVSAPAPGVSQPAAAVRQPASAVPDPALANTGAPLPATSPAPAPDITGRKPASSADDNFFWAWENDATNDAKGKAVTGIVPPESTVVESVKAVLPEKPAPPAIPAEIADLSAGEPRPSKSGAVMNKEAPAVQPQPAPAGVIESPASDIAKPVAVIPAQETGRVDAKAYDELIKENLDLHKKIAETKQGKDMVKQENERLAREVKDLEQKISDSISRIKDLATQKDASAVVPARMKDLETRLEKAEQEKAALGVQLATLQKKAAAQGREPAAPVAEAAVRRLTAAGEKPSAEPVKAGSDLYIRLERENMLLKQKLGDIESERQKAVKAREDTEKREKLAADETKRALESQKQMKEKLEEVKSGEKKQKRLMVDLAGRIPDMEKEMTVLQKKISEKDAALKEKDRNLEVLANEVEQRENRIRKAEKMVDLMEQAQKDVNQVSDSEKRDMHYNMAAVYSQVGRYADAEREYLRALRLDPADADVHYNLGILYDENLNDKPRAAMHYRRYLKLRPSGPDVDAVKNWLIHIDMKQ